MKMNKQLLLPLIIFLIVIFGWILVTPEPDIVQPIQYNHKKHIEDAELDCTDCHIYVESNAKATIPNIEICSNCHSDEPMTDSPEEEKLLSYIEKGEKIPWVQIYSVPDHVYFSHRRHVTIGNLECKTCHGNVPELIKPAPHQLIQISMNNCIDCHREKGIERDCIGCHN